MKGIIENLIATRNPRRFKFLPDKTYLSIKYKWIFKTEIDWRCPKTFNEKLQWLKLYDRNPMYTVMVDKYAVKKYVSSIIGSQYIIPTIGVWDKFDDIDFDELPSRFVLKCTHDSGGLVICSNKEQLDILLAKEKLENSLRTNYYWSGREWPYKNVKPRIIAEQYIGDNLLDYKLFCFNGKPRLTLVCSERFSKGGLKEDFYDELWNHLNIQRKSHCNANLPIPEPKQYELMKLLAGKLSSRMTFARIDFYEINGKVYFGEITLYPASGFEGFIPKDWDLRLGEWIKLPLLNL